jgi:DNA-binding Lrp family transcriptional regulator
MKNKKIYTVIDIADTLNVSEKEVLEVVKRYNYGTVIKGEYVLTRDEVDDVIGIYNCNYRIESARIIAIIKRNTPIKYGKLLRIYNSLYDPIKRGRLRAVVDKISIDGTYPDLWEDDDMRLGFGGILND